MRTPEVARLPHPPIANRFSPKREDYWDGKTKKKQSSPLGAEYQTSPYEIKMYTSHNRCPLNTRPLA